MSYKKICQVKCESNQPGAMAVTGAITNRTTPEEFENLRKKFPQFQIHFGGRCGWNVFGACALAGNATLLSYLIETYGTMFVNVGNEFGHTPIFCATKCHDESAAIACINVLLKYNADPTIATSMMSLGDTLTEKGTTPLENCVKLKKEYILGHLERVLGVDQDEPSD